MDDLISREQALDAIHDWKPSDVFDEFNPTTAFTIICALPSANQDLSGYSDRLWKSAYDRGYERCKQDAIDVAKQHWYKPDIAKALEDLPSAQPDLLDDGTLMMTVPNGMLNDVKRVLVDEIGTKFCKTMYQDAERKKGTWIPVDSYSAFGGDEATWMAHGNPIAFYYCSECKKQARAGEDGESLLTDYCPDCGAEMEGEKHV